MVEELVEEIRGEMCWRTPDEASVKLSESIRARLW